LDVVNTFAEVLGLTLKKINLFNKIQELALIDDLTKIYVRRHFMKLFDEELERSRRLSSPLCFLMLDLDHFKKCNDKYGHLAGDSVLKETADIIKKSVREIDLVARYGGEEFAVLLPNTGLENCYHVAERIRKAIEIRSFYAYDEKIHITISIGISSFPLDGEGIEELINKADLALYSAKQKGRNKVVSYQEIK
jgi:diguanylate cyclase (GGDEF)-like protein